MRPKKVILCVDDNEQELSVLKFMLATNGYRVLSGNNGQEAIGIFSDMPGRPGAGRLRHAADEWRSTGEPAEADRRPCADDPARRSAEDGRTRFTAPMPCWPRRHCSPQELLERIKVMSARKRGPRKGTLRAWRRPRSSPSRRRGQGAGTRDSNVPRVQASDPGLDRARSDVLASPA